MSVLRYPRETASFSPTIFRPDASTAAAHAFAHRVAPRVRGIADLSTSETATSKGKAGKATPTCASRSRFRLRARIPTPRVASTTIAAEMRAPRASLFVPRPRSQIQNAVVGRKAASTRRRRSRGERRRRSTWLRSSWAGKYVRCRCRTSYARVLECDAPSRDLTGVSFSDVTMGSGEPTARVHSLA